MSDMLNLELLIKLLKMTSSSNDGEALIAMRKANEAVARFTDWDTLLRGKITIVEDPFNSIDRPARSNGATTKAPPPPPASWGQRAPAPTPPPSRPARPAPKPAPKVKPTASPLPDVTYTKNSNGDWVIRSTKPLTPGQTIDVTSKRGAVRTVIIDAAIGLNNYGDHLYSFHNAPTPDLGSLA